jgi:hypothetical protein
MKAPFYVHPSNREILEKILDLQDESGNPVILPVQKDLLIIIARFDKKRGNFMTTKNFQGEMKGKSVTTKTLLSHLKYLVAIGVVEETRENHRGKSFKVRRILEPEPGAKMTLKDFRRESGVSSYKREKFSVSSSPEKGKNFPSEEEKFSPEKGKNFPLIGERDLEGGKEGGELLPKAPPRGEGSDDLASAPRTVPDDPSGRPPSGDLRPREEDPPPSLNSSDPYPGDVLYPKRNRGKKKKNTGTQRERELEAQRLRADGHLVSPLGKPKPRGRMIKWKRARPIGDEGRVTIPQLWRAYNEIFKESFGLENLEEQMTPSKENVARYFDDMRQRFLDETGRAIDNRAIFGYLLWMHAPERLPGLLKGGKKGIVHPNQLLGLVHIRRYYKEVLGRLENKDDTDPGQAKYQFLQDAYDQIRQAGSEIIPLIQCMTNYGYVIFAEWLHDYHGMDGSKCKKKIIGILSEFLGKSKNVEAACRMLESATSSAEANEKLFQSAVWEDWRGNCADIVALAKENTGESGNGEG